MRIKICGLCRSADASLAAAAGVDYVGVILAPGSARTQAEAQARAIFAAAPALARVGVFVNEDAERTAAAARTLGLSAIQLHGDEGPDLADALRAAGPWRVWKALRPQSGEDFAVGLARFATHVDGILVDGFSAAARGGTGASFPWGDVARFRGQVPDGVEFIVAGGLTPENVARAVELLRPDTVDVSSGVELERCMKSEDRVRAFVEAARAAATPEPVAGREANE